ncbi:MAG: DUF4339 domain-containing protein [Burkholderiaceae bacterium]|jgi:hypothetical protein|nr:DUF4339 domain-containing protein [Burkholderiaceae bacterium]
MNATQSTTIQWFYEDKGQRKGPVSEEAMTRLIQSSTISRGTPVWKQGLPEWIPIEDTDLRAHLDTTSPPPLSGDHINNTLVWILAFAPLIGYLLEWVVAGAIHNGNEYAMERAMGDSKYWFITLGLNIVLSFADEKHLRKAGHNTSKFKGWVWLVPVYLYQRARATKQNLAYFSIWIICFVVTLIG